MKLFLDANVLIDFMGERVAYYMQAATLFSFAAEHECEIVVSSLSMVTSNYICCERGKMPLALWNNKVNEMNNFVEVGSVDSSDILLSCNAGWKDIEDCVQFHVAKRCGCDAIVTRNTGDFVHSDIDVLSPEQAIDRVLETLH